VLVLSALAEVMQQFRIVLVALAIGLAFGGGAAAEEPAKAPEHSVVSDGSQIEACAKDPSHLGVSRVVEVDTESGPSFGGSHLDFLKDHEVVLTFDDGPMRHHTGQVLAALAEQCTKATFFMVGRMAAANPEMVKEVAAAGHTVATHTWSHLNQRALSMVRGVREIELGVSAVSRALGRPAAPFFRYPYLSDNRRIANYVKSRNMATWWVDIDSKDYTTRNSKRAHDRIMAQLAARKKGIILMHDIQPSTVNGIRVLLEDLHAKGFKVVHIVPKAAVTTIAAYDEDVEKMSSKKVATSDHAHDHGSGSSAASDVEKNDSSIVTSRTASKRSKTHAHRHLGIRSQAKPEKAPRKVAEQLPWQPGTFGYR
jgi:peptidoglycan/xylan/chitin deacetylase (PgdA/CDA1 family)